ncbi:MAG: hypothetical protein JW940_11485 [Polyangiaceae bacterium]|nr:hypothetical protein [Polyangiaceae bacterium]
MRYRACELFAWLVPLVVVLEFVGSTFGSPLVATVGFAALLVGAAWLASPETLATRPDPRRARPGRWMVGVGCLVLGGVLAAPALLALSGQASAARAFAVFPSRDLQLLLPVLGVWPLVVGWAWVSERRVDSTDLRRLGLLVAIVFLGLLASGHRVQSLAVAAPRAASAFAPIAIVLLVLLALPRLPWLFVLAASGVLGVALRCFGLDAWSPDPLLRDMLPLVQDAQHALLRGDPPYAVYQMQRGSLVPLTYFPGLWLLSLPATAAGLDLRLVSVLADVGVVGALAWAAGGVAAPQRRGAQDLVVALSAVWWFSPSVQWNVVYAEAHPWWGLLALTVAALLRRRLWLGAALLGFGLATRQFALVLLPFAALLLIREVGWRGAAARLGLAGAVASSLLVPFVATDPEPFWFGTLRWLWEYGPAHQTWFYQKYGFSGTLYQLEATGWMSAAQAASIVVTSVVAAVVRRRRAVLAALVTAYVGVVMNNRIIWDNFYLDVFVLLASVAVGAGSLWQQPAVCADRPVTARTPRLRLAESVGLVAFVGSVAAAGYLLYTWRVATDETGRSEMAAMLRRRVQRGDLIVDRADWRLAFVRPAWLVRPGSTRASVAADLFDGTLSPRRRLRYDRVWLATRSDRDRDLRSRVRRLGRLLSEQRYGRYELLCVAPDPVRERLADRLEEADIELRRGSQSIARGRPGASGWSGPGLAAVTGGKCRLGRGHWPTVFARPVPGATLSLHWPRVELGDRLLVFGGIEDQHVTRGHGPMGVDVEIAAHSAGRVDLVNRPGVSWDVVDTRRWAGKKVDVTLRVATSDDAERWACVDAVVMGGGADHDERIR